MAKPSIIERAKRIFTGPAPTVKPGDIVTLNSGRKVGTNESPGSTDLRGLKCVVVDSPQNRVGAVDVSDGDGQPRERVHVQPLSGDGRLGIPLDVPTERIAPQSRRKTRSVAGWGPGTLRGVGGRLKGRYDPKRGEMVYSRED